MISSGEPSKSVLARALEALGHNDLAAKIKAEKPSLLNLIELNIPQKVGTHYYDFGIILLKNEDGSLINVIESDCHEKCEAIV